MVNLRRLGLALALPMMGKARADPRPAAGITIITSYLGFPRGFLSFSI